jgi:futalosine hydrolase
MRALIVAATEPEIASLRGRANLELLVTGVGMVATAARTARALALSRCDVAFNFGVCGSFDPSLPPGSVVHIVSDRIAELGAEDGDAFLTLDQLGLPGDSVVVNPEPPVNAALSALPSVTGITVNTAHGSERSIADVSRRLSPQVESMEGAAFMYACHVSGVPYAQVRVVSNIVERRNRAAWSLDAAIGSLGRTAAAILDSL